MSKFLKIMIVLLTIVAVAAPVMAEDRLGLSGQMRVRGWHIDDGGDTTESWADQRLRIGGKFSIAEGVSVTFRTDVTEANWGANAGFGSGRLPASNANQWDRAHLDIASGNLHLRAGQQYLAFGNSGFDAQDNGLTLNYKGAIPVTAFWMINDDGGGESSTDSYYYGIKAGHKGESYASSIYLAGQTDVSDAGENVMVIGVTLDYNLDAVALYGEVDFFMGDATEDTDAAGTNLMLQASMAATETINVGGQFFFSPGEDEDVKYDILGNDFGGWDPLFAIGTGLDNEQIGTGRPWGIFGDAGVMAFRVFGDVKASDDLTVSGSLAFLQSEDDDIADDDAMALAVGCSYSVMANTSLGVQIEYIDVDSLDDEILQAGTGLFVNF
ncbi:MAG: porin [Desulfuromonadales bacterium]|nr:porin [Desulfuromonadales bacterium]